MYTMSALLAAVAVAAAPLSATAAGGLVSPAGEVLLVVSGNITVSNDGETAQFDMEMLRRLGEVTFSTSTPWTEGTQTFTGASLADLVAALGVTHGGLRATAVNEYSVRIPIDDAVPGGPIIAYLRNGEPMSVRDKGPLWIVYPYDADTKYQAEAIYSRSIWQLNRIEVTE